MKFRNEQIGWVGIDIGSACVKVAQLARHGDQFRVHAQAIVPRSTRSDLAGLPESEVALASVAGEIRAGCTLNESFQGRQAAATVPMNICDIHHLDAIEGSHSDLNSLVRKTIESITQASAEHLQFDIWPAELDARSKQPARWNVLAVAQPWSDQLYRDVTHNGFACKLLDSTPHALARAVELAEPGSVSTPQAVLDWGHCQATFAIVLDHRPVYVRSLKDCGLQRTIAAISESLDLVDEESLVLLQTHGLSASNKNDRDEVSEMIFELVTAEVLHLAQEVERTLKYLGSQRRALLPRKFHLFGGGAQIPGIDHYLTDRLQVEAKVWRLCEEPVTDTSTQQVAQCLLGPALSLSALAWGER